MDPSSGRPVVRSSENSSRSRWTRAGGSVGLGAGGSSSMCGPASAARSSSVPESAANAARPGSYGMDSVTSVRAGERLHERPFGAGEILEAVGEERRSAPCVQVAAQAFDGIPTHAVTIAHAHPPQLLAIRADERRELAAQPVQLDEPSLELADRLQQRVREPRRTRREAQTVQFATSDRAPNGERALGLGGDRKRIVGTFGDRPEQVVEGPDGAREERRTTPDQVTLDAIDVDPVRDDEPRIAFEDGEVALQEQRDLADMRRPHDKRKTHRSIVVPASGASSYALRKERAIGSCRARGRAAR